MARVTVLLAVRNGLPYLDESIQSITDQTFSDFELIVVDDGSTDQTPVLLARWERADPRIVVIRQANEGQASSLNRAIGLAAGHYLARQDADDISEPERLARQVAHLDEHPQLAVVGTSARVIDAHGKEIGLLRAPGGPRAVKRSLWRENVLNHGSVMMRREALDKVGAYRAAFRFAKDWDLWLRLVQQGFEIDNLPDFLYRWRLNPEGAYARERSRQVKFAGLALMFGRERERYREDSYPHLRAFNEDVERFAAGYRLRGPLYALWGELCLRSLSDRTAATRYLLRALASGYVRPRLLAFLCLSLSGVGWPGRPRLRSG